MAWGQQSVCSTMLFNNIAGLARPTKQRESSPTAPPQRQRSSQQRIEYSRVPAILAGGQYGDRAACPLTEESLAPCSTRYRCYSAISPRAQSPTQPDYIYSLQMNHGAEDPMVPANAGPSLSRFSHAPRRAARPDSSSTPCQSEHTILAAPLCERHCRRSRPPPSPAYPSLRTRRLLPYRDPRRLRS
jgi:hypothetical protein